VHLQLTGWSWFYRTDSQLKFAQQKTVVSTGITNILTEQKFKYATYSAHSAVELFCAAFRTWDEMSGSQAYRQWQKHIQQIHHATKLLIGVCRFLTAHQHIKHHSVPCNGYKKLLITWCHYVLCNYSSLHKRRDIKSTMSE